MRLSSTADRFSGTARDTDAGRHGARTIGLQATLAAVVMSWLLVVPPAQGRMMLVPLDGRASAALPALALHGETRLVATGPIPGSLIVYGRRDDLAARLLAHGILTVATPLGGCAPGIAA